MQNTELKKIITYTCDECNKNYEDKYISFDLIDDIQMRILEYKPQTLNNHYTYGRKKLDFCSTKCAMKYLNWNMEVFIQEITASLPSFRNSTPVWG